MSFWPELLPELRNLVRGELDTPTAHMLGYTCKKERSLAHGGMVTYELPTIFGLAAELGHLAICQWVYETTLSWSHLNKGRNPLPYHSVLYYGHALEHEQFHVAEWAHTVGLVLPATIWVSLIRANALPGLKWLAAHQIERHLDNDDVDFAGLTRPTTQWLLEECGLRATARSLRGLFILLPHSKHQFFLCLGQRERGALRNFVPICARWAIANGRWSHIDFLYDNFSDSMLKFEGMLHPQTQELLVRRPTVPPGHVLNLETGAVEKMNRDRYF
jgi:hypothetical protein